LYLNFIRVLKREERRWEYEGKIMGRIEKRKRRGKREEEG
jgi:hypothetical protein